MREHYTNGYFSVFKGLVFLRGRGRRGLGRLGGVAWARMVEGITEASNRKYKWGLLQTGRFLKPRERKKPGKGVGVVRDMTKGMRRVDVVGRNGFLVEKQFGKVY